MKRQWSARLGQLLAALALLSACERASTTQRHEAQPQKTPSAPLAPAGQSPKAQQQAEPPALPAEQAVLLYEALAQAHQLEKTQGCKELAAQLEEFQDAHRGELQQITPRSWSGIEADTALQTRARSALELVMTASMKCRDAPDMQRLRAAGLSQKM